MSATSTYTAIHRALAMSARKYDIEPFDARFLLGISDRGGSARTDELARDLGVDQSAIRRSVGNVRDYGLIVTRAVDGRGVRRGVRTVASLTESGLDVAISVMALVTEGMET